MLQVKTLESEEDRKEFPLELCDPRPMPLKSNRDKPVGSKSKVVDKADKSTGEDSDDVIFEDFDEDQTDTVKSQQTDGESVVNQKRPPKQTPAPISEDLLPSRRNQAT